MLLRSTSALSNWSFSICLFALSKLILLDFLIIFFDCLALSTILLFLSSKDRTNIRHSISSLNFIPDLTIRRRFFSIISTICQHFSIFIGLFFLFFLIFILFRTLLDSLLSLIIFICCHLNISSNNSSWFFSRNRVREMQKELHNNSQYNHKNS
jgi:hypothetical protein